MTPTPPIRRDLVLVGGGHTHVHVIKAFGMRPLSGVRVTLVAREVHAPYSGMLPGLVAGRYTYDEAHIDLRRLCRWAGVRLLRDEARALDLEARRVHCAARPPLSFDLLSLNVGATPRTRGVPGAAEHAMPVKPVDRFLEEWRRLIDGLPGAPEGLGAPSGPFRIAVVGGGAGGVELALACRRRISALLRARCLPRGAVRFTLFTEAEEIVPELHPRARRALARILEARGIQVRTGSRVSRVEGDALHVGEGRIPADRVLWVTDASPPEWIGETGLETTPDGFLRVDATLRSTSHPFVFAAGDVATVAPHPRPKSGVFAVRQGPPLERNLRRALRGEELRPFRPQREFLTLLGTGDSYAVGSRGPLAFRGRWVWRLKEWIDRRWMAKWSDLPEMEEGSAGRSAEPLPPGGPGADGEAAEGDAGNGADPSPVLAQEPMRCGGCGGKVGAEILERALREASADDGDPLGRYEPQDASVLDVPPGMRVVQSVDFFRDFLDDPYRFGAVAAHHALNDLWASGAEPRSALAVVTLPHGPEKTLVAELVHLLRGAGAVLDAAGASLAGGHTAEGAELAFGLQVTGFVRPGALLRKSGARPGDRLVLTGPLGTGTLFAADMRAKAKARWVEEALATMCRSNGPAAAILGDHGIRACTDVSGFGLLGHLVELLRASGAGARLDPSALPALPGSLECIEAGITSTLHPENLRLRRAVVAGEEERRSPRFALLFDPQTAGGLLGAVPAEGARACVDALHGAGYARAGVIGEVVEPRDSLRSVELVAPGRGRSEARCPEPAALPR